MTNKAWSVEHKVDKHDVEMCKSNRQNWPNGWLKNSKMWTWLELQYFVCVSDEGWASDRWSMGSPHNRITAHRCHIHTYTATWPYSDRRRGRGFHPKPHTKRGFMFTHTHTKMNVVLKHTHTETYGPLHRLQTGVNIHWYTLTQGNTWDTEDQLHSSNDIFRASSSSNFTGCSCVIHSCCG